MIKTISLGLTALFLTASPIAYAQAPQGAAPMQERRAAPDLKALTEARIAVVKAALQLTPEQMKYWPAIEEAIRSRAATRQQRLANLAARRNQPVDFQPIDFMRRRADVLAERAAGLKKLADAWQPLYATLDEDQKRRMRVVAVLAIRELRNAVDSRMQDDDDEDED